MRHSKCLLKYVSVDFWLNWGMEPHNTNSINNKYLPHHHLGLEISKEGSCKIFYQPAVSLQQQTSKQSSIESKKKKLDLLNIYKMSLSKFLFLSSLSSFILWSTSIHAAVFQIQNNCSYTVWAAANPGGGRELRQGQSWIVNTDPNFNDGGRIWARTNCSFDGNGTGICESGDCNGVLYCVSDGAFPLTLAEYSFRGAINNMDFFDVSLVTGFNVPIEFKGNSSGCNKVTRCTGDVNGLCPTELRHPGGCNHPCSVFKNDQFCCSNSTNCRPTAYSKFFKDLCPDAYSYAVDDATSTFTCPTGTDYKVVFCPWSLNHVLDLFHSFSFFLFLFDYSFSQSYRRLVIIVP